jgi:hypothetical protein
MGGSMSSIVVSGDTSGSVTLAVPAVAGANTVTIAAQTGTLNAAGPAFNVYGNASQSLTSATFTKVALNTETFDTNNNFDSTTNYRFTPTVAGYYQINATLRFTAATAATQVLGTIYKNGSEYFRGLDTPMSSTNTVSTFSISTIVYFNGSSDYIELYGYSYLGTTVALSYSSAAVCCQMSGCLVRGA